MDLKLVYVLEYPCLFSKCCLTAVIQKKKELTDVYLLINYSQEPWSEKTVPNIVNVA